MRELKRGSIGLFFVISLLVSIGAVNADIIVNGPDQTAVNIGDDITISGYVIRDDDVLGLLKFDLVCGGQKNVLMVKSISLKANEKKDFSDEFAIVSVGEGNCNVDVSLDSQGTVLESKSSSSFEVTSSLTGTFTIDKESAQTGEIIRITGSAFKQDGNPVEGFAIITMKKDGEIYFSDSVDVEDGIIKYDIDTTDVPGGEYNVDVEVRNSFGNVVSSGAGSFLLISKIDVNAHTVKVHYFPKEKVKITGTANVLEGKLKKGFVYVTMGEDKYEADLRNGNFDLDFYLLNTIVSGKHDIVVRIEDENGNFGEYEFSIIVDPIPTKIVIVVDKEAISPGSTLNTKAFLNDQAGDLIEEDVTIKVVNEKGDEYFDSVKGSGEQFEITIGDNVVPGNYFVRGTYGDVEGEKIFVVGQVVLLDYSIEGQILIVKNIGNVPYEGPLQIELEGFDKTSSISKNINLGINQIIKIDIGEGIASGNYDVTVNENVFEDVEVIGVKKSNYWWVAYVAVIWLFLLIWLMWKGNKRRLRRRIRSTIEKGRVVRPNKKILPRGKHGEYGGAPLSRVKNDRDHVKKYSAYMDRLKSFKKRPKVNPIRGKGLFSRIFKKKKKGYEDLTVNDVFSGVKKDWTRSDGVKTYGDGNYQNRISRIDDAIKKNKKNKEKDGDEEEGPSGNLFGIFDK
tara:strand:+ start:1756 stop:3789 length:2034 start_codon:yes stop_codon:yes gene_type:complete